MKTEKLSLKNIKNMLTRAEMKKIMAGSDPCASECNNNWECDMHGSNSNCVILSCFGEYHGFCSPW